jgi:hypothetical protein
MRYIQQLCVPSPQTIGDFAKKKYVYDIENQVPDLYQKQTDMLYDTYGEEYLNFLKDLNEILSVNELVELDYL